MPKFILLQISLTSRSYSYLAAKTQEDAYVQHPQAVGLVSKLTGDITFATIDKSSQSDAQYISQYLLNSFI